MSNSVICNPILRGFNPDPSILRVGDDYFIATSTFEWFPGIRLHHSRDLIHWEVIGHALSEPSALDLRGIPDSGGVWAPSLTYVNGEFWLAYSVIRTMDGDNKDLDNYLITSPSIAGPWSVPIPLGSRGFDFSFFHDVDGKHWIVGVQWDQRPDHASFAGLVLEEYDHTSKKVAGTTTTLLRSAGLIEGPNIYLHNGWYYLLIAQGGTGWNHGVSMARSRSLHGPYEVDPQTSILTSRDNDDLALQKAGHGELVHTASGQWLLVHLASRPVIVGRERYCITGRETSLQHVKWTADGWLRLVDDSVNACVTVDLGEVAPAKRTPVPQSARDDFDLPAIDSRRFSTLRAPVDSDLVSRPGWVRVHGAHSPSSVFAQSMFAQRIEENSAYASLVVDAEPSSTRQAAGLVAWYNRQQWVWAQVTWDAEHGRHVRLVIRDLTETKRSSAHSISDGPVMLSFALNDGVIQFFVNENPLGDPQSAWKLSDDYGPGLRFTGCFAGFRVDDLDSMGWHADFDYFELKHRRV